MVQIQTRLKIWNLAVFVSPLLGRRQRRTASWSQKHMTVIIVRVSQSFRDLSTTTLPHLQRERG